MSGSDQDPRPRRPQLHAGTGGWWEPETIDMHGQVPVEGNEEEEEEEKEEEAEEG